MAFDCLHRRVERKADADAAAVLGKAAREDEGVARTFLGREEAATDQVLDRPEHRLDGDASFDIGLLELEPVLAQQRPIAVALLKAANGAEQVEYAPVVAAVPNACLGAERPELGQARHHAAQHAKRVGAIVFSCAVGEELHRPAPELRIAAEAEPQRRILLEYGFEKRPERPGRSP